MPFAKKFYSPKKWRDDGPVFKNNGENEYHKINRKKNTKLRKIFSTFFLAFLLLFFIGGTVGAGYYAWLMKHLPSPDRIIERQIQQTTKLYDREGKEILYEVHGNQNRTVLELKDISPYVIGATISAEDKNFYKHHGFDLRGIFRSVLLNIFKGTRVGGSSITQQFVKKAVLTEEKTYTRKIKELLIAIQLENKFSKDQILKMYLNEIPYGSVTYGIQSAAKKFFGKDAKDLSISESAVLAALPNAPSYYSPYGSNREALVARYEYVINAMVEGGYITKEEGENAKKDNVFSRIKDDKVSITAPHFVFYVKDVLSEMFGERMVEEGGLKVTTSLDIGRQKAAEKALEDNRKKINSYGGTNAALVSLNSKNGEVVAMVGSFDYFDKTIDGAVNVCLRPRQPGSSFKPIVYATGLARGYTPNTILYDVTTTFPTQVEGGYTPHNYDLREHGPVSVRKALAGSLNIPAVKMIYLAGINNVLDMADSLGYTTLKDRSRYGLSLVLGGGEVKLLEHAAAYSVFANDGMLIKPNPILKVEDSTGRVLYEAKPETKNILNEEVARQMTSILSDNGARSYIFGANNYLNLGFPAGAKTGTTNDYKDAWTIGFTPELITGVWVGKNDNTEMKRGADGSVVAAPIWNQYMKEAVRDKTKTFTDPMPVITGKPILDGEEMPGTVVKIDKASGKLATEFTPTSYIVEEKTFKEVHDILYYVDKDNPQGPIPQDPAADPYFNAWESAVQEWAAKNSIVNQLPPTGYDDVHIPANKPQISITSPQNNSSIERIFNATVKASAPRGVSRVEYFIDNNLVFTAQSSPFYGLVTIPSDVGKGFHLLKAVAYDDIDNSNSHEIYINFVSGATVSSGDFSWISPQNNSVISSFPINISFNASAVNISFWYKKSGSTDYYKIGESAGPNGYSSVVWSGNGVEKGTYELKAVIQEASGTKERNLNVVVQ
ncbi:MAG: PBP1A family penicillin-binding protein [Patescibacteria group bacterium]